MLEQIMTIDFVTAFLTASVRMVVPLIYTGLGEAMSEETGILNIDVEGVVLGGAFLSFVGTLCSGSLAVGLLCGMMGGAMVSATHGLLSIRLARDQSASGTIINIFMVGVTSFLYKLMLSGRSYQQIEPFTRLEMPSLGDVPLIGDALFSQDILIYGVYVLVILVALFYSRMLKEVVFAAIRESLRTTNSAGIPVHRYQWVAVLLDGALGGPGGAYLILVQVGNFSGNMTPDRGYIALVAIVLGQYAPFETMGAAFIFGATNVPQIRLQTIGAPLPAQALAILPYIITLVTLLGSIDRSSTPEVLGKPYIRGVRQVSGIMIDSSSGLQ